MIEDILLRQTPELRDLGATGLYVYGSRARGDFRESSDLDLYIDYDKSRRVPSLFRLIAIEQQMERDLGYPVSITTRQSLHPMMRAEIERESVKVF